MLRSTVVIFFVIFIAHKAWSQEVPSLFIQKAKSPIEIDGVLDEPDWLASDSAFDFFQQFPFDSSKAVMQSVVKATYDDRFIYFGAICYSSDPSKFVVPSLRRDFFGQGIDLFAVILDTYQDVTNAFTFGTNPAGVQREGLVAGGGTSFERGGLDFTWDNKWFNAVKITNNAWVIEMAIPFKSIRFKEGSKEWNINFYRQDSKGNERSHWAGVPRNFMSFALNYHGKLVWDVPLKKPGVNISLIPYVAERVSRDFENGEELTEKFTFGGDAKIAVTSALNLDMTINPDFSNVEVDRQQTNLNRFELFFPERRQFFIENQDLFATYGGPFTRPFFSRRIGLALDTSTGQFVQNQILFGARLSGNLNNKWRVGLLNMQAAKDDDIGLASYNYGVAAVQRRVGSNSNIRGIFVNKQDFKNPDDYDRVIGGDYNYNFQNNKYTGAVYVHQQLNDEFKGSELDSGLFTHGFDFNYNTPNLQASYFHTIVGDNYSPEVGFAPRKGFKRMGLNMSYAWYPQSDIVNNHGPGFDFSGVHDNVYGISDHELVLFYQFQFQNSARLSMGVAQTYTLLTFNYDPSESDGLELAAGTEYTNYGAGFEFNSDQRKKFNARIQTRGGQYFNGTLINVGGSLNYRMQPFGVFSVDFDVSSVRLPAPYNSADILLIGPRIDLTLTKSLFWTTFVQYNSQFDNVNINSRVQWRFKPVSDLFIVYTDNYFYDFRNSGGNFGVKNRALVVKLTYWLNL